MAGDKQVSADTYVRYLIATVRGMAAAGRCVVIGRGAAHVLPAETTLRVRLVGERADRIRTVERLHHLAEREAERWLERTEQERSEFVRRHLGIDTADPHYYDLILNSSRFSDDECAETIVQTFARFETRILRAAAG
jgi:cytidylate kinase